MTPHGFISLTVLRILSDRGPMRWADVRKELVSQSLYTATLSSLVDKGFVASTPAQPEMRTAKGRPSTRIFEITDAGRARIQAFRRALGVSEKRQ